MTVYTLVRIYEYGPALSKADVRKELMTSLYAGMRYYLENGVDGGPSYNKADILNIRITSAKSRTPGLTAKRLKAEVEFST